jgi:Calcineurin-like phosphoesterase
MRYRDLRPGCRKNRSVLETCSERPGRAADSLGFRLDTSREGLEWTVAARPVIKRLMTPRTIVIGDLHGCATELEEILRATEACATDRILCVGDLICKGPDSRAVLDWAMRTPNVECVLGNHEARFLECWKNGEVPDRKPYDRETYDQLTDRFDDYMRFVARWPRYREEKDFLLVHAGIDPRVDSLEEQDPTDLMALRNLPGTDTPWFEAYERDRLVVFGHWVRRDPVIRPNAIGLDTGCVYGNRLSALVLPERRVVQIRARREYRRKKSWPT